MSVTTLRFSRTSDLAVGVDVILATLTLNGVNAELSPLVRMMAPAAFAQRPLQEWPERQHLFTSWILLLGVLPVDRHAFYLHSVMPGKGFVETSSSTINALWKHERTILPIEAGCRVTDAVEYRCRLPLLGYLLKPVYTLVFWHRHRYLRSRYGGHDDAR
jgi:hypothetical protein